MSVYIPCLNADHPDNGGAWSVGIGVGAGGEGAGGLSPGIAITHSDSPVGLTITPFPPFIWPAINWAYMYELFGLGETRIEREKEAIQDIFTPIFRYLKKTYGVPLRDNHALQFQSDGVQDQFRRRPDIAALLPYVDQNNDMVASLIFARENPSSGQEERVSNQFLANAAINNWPVHSTLEIWDGIVDAANPNCTTVPDRWKHNPDIMQRTAEMAVIAQYISLPVLTNMATYHAIGDYIGEQLILQWAMNPALIQDIPFRQVGDWQRIYSENRWAAPPYGNPFGGTIPLLKRDHILPLIQGINVPHAQYPDFIVPPGQEPPPVVEIPPYVPEPGTPPPTIPPGQPLPPSPTPQPPTPPPLDQYPEPPPEHERERPPAEHEGTPDQYDLEFACDYWRLSDQIAPIPQSYVDWTLTTNGRTALRLMREDPYCRQYRPQPPTPPPDEQVGEIPNQQDLDRACDILRKLFRRESLSQADYDWMLTNIGARALAIATNDPACQPQPDDGETPIPQPQEPECPTPQLPYPQPQPYPSPYPQPQPYPYPQPQPRPGEQPCPPECTQLIELLRQRMEQCCELTQLVVIPRLDWLTRWLIDVENRLPGPMPPIDVPPPYPAPIPPGPTIPVPVPEEPTEPPVIPPPLLPPEIVACLETLCDQEKFCQMVQACERELECREMLLCDPTGGPWGAMAECWLEANSPGEEDLEQSYAGQQFPSYGVNQFLFAWDKAMVDGARQRGFTDQGPILPGDQGELGEYYQYAAPYVEQFLAAFQGGEYDPPGTEDPEIVEPEFIFADPATLADNKFKYVSVKVRPGEIDPCTGVAEEVLEIPSQGVQP